MKNHQFILIVIVFLTALTVFSSINKYKQPAVQTQAYTEEMDCLARNVYYEAGNEPFEGKLAVAQVTVNRANNPNFPHKLCDVVYQRTYHKKRVVCQFSWTCDNVSPQKNWIRWQEARYIATKVLTIGLTSDIIRNTNALYYHADYVEPGWNKHHVVTRIGHHIFYKDI
ncbi:SleB Cell wall hydrolyses involved in spore germination [uncultured Caudovirales phage]|uniref:SleB Cell wall hydrolyses involved in spore germination n=1 Tax=uncultured Caudovirales phage TaxID=2100421 RepID=A0A6J5LJ19_9CAUD|nr:SleB Cell wall hydrolyses involved in spore germination [uncultured Caudovirales phage]